MFMKGARVKMRYAKDKVYARYFGCPDRVRVQSSEKSGSKFHRVSLQLQRGLDRPTRPSRRRRLRSRSQCLPVPAGTFPRPVDEQSILAETASAPPSVSARFEGYPRSPSLFLNRVSQSYELLLHNALGGSQRSDPR